MTKILAIAGSPRKDGNSAALLRQVVAGAEDAGASVETYFLHELNIRPCDACDACKSLNECVIDDDMQKLYPKLREADVLVIASPIYYFTVSTQTKLFMDRWYSLGEEFDSALHGKQVAIVLTYGGDDVFSSGAVNAIRTFQDTFRYLGVHIAGMVYGKASDAGEIKADKQLMDKAYELGRKLAAGKS